MRVSIVTISFNQREFLERTIRSVLEQDYPDIQYIVVDPGSTDGSRELIESFGDRIHRVFEPDKGAADGLNNGFAHADGQVLGYLNSDDILYPGAVRKAVEYLARHPKTDVVCGHALIIDEHDEMLRKSFSQRFKLVEYAYGACIVNQPSSFFRRSAWEKTSGFNADNRSNWDGELWVDMAKAGIRFSVMEDFLSGYRLHSDSITGSAKIDAAIKAYNGYIFEKIMGRPMNTRDRYLSKLYRLRRFLLNPRDLIERVLHGPIYRRAA